MRRKPIASEERSEEFLRLFGERVRGTRAGRGMSRRLLAAHAGISERYITQLESGKGNVSILILRQIANALGLPMTQLVGDQKPSPELALLQGFLSTLAPSQLREATENLQLRFGTSDDASRHRRIALIGLRGAGKTTLGRAAAERLYLPFFELDREIEQRSGTSIGSVLELYGQQAYRRYELESLDAILARQSKFIVATGGSLVSETATYELLLRRCFVVWIRTAPEEHMARVIAQGDRRPMAGSSQAMDDLRRILEERTPLYSRADATLDTTGKSEEASLAELLALLPPEPPTAELKIEN